MENMLLRIAALLLISSCRMNTLHTSSGMTNGTARNVDSTLMNLAMLLCGCHQRVERCGNVHHQTCFNVFKQDRVVGLERYQNTENDYIFNKCSKIPFCITKMCNASDNYVHLDFTSWFNVIVRNLKKKNVRAIKNTYDIVSETRNIIHHLKALNISPESCKMEEMSLSMFQKYMSNSDEQNRECCFLFNETGICRASCTSVETLKLKSNGTVYKNEVVIPDEIGVKSGYSVEIHFFSDVCYAVCFKIYDVTTDTDWPFLLFMIGLLSSILFYFIRTVCKNQGYGIPLPSKKESVLIAPSLQNSLRHNYSNEELIS